MSDIRSSSVLRCIHLSSGTTPEQLMVVITKH
jgi:hypothetical protein